MSPSLPSSTPTPGTTNARQTSPSGAGSTLKVGFSVRKRGSVGSPSSIGSTSEDERHDNSADPNSSSSARGQEVDPSHSRRSISRERRQDSSNFHASSICLFDFRQSGISFYWGEPGKTHVTLEDGPWPLTTLGQPLGIQTGDKNNTLVYAAAVTKEKHGLQDTVALKVVKCRNLEDKKYALIEISNLQKLCHNHIVAFAGSYIQGAKIGILMFPVAKYDLDQFLKSRNIGTRLHLMRPWFSCLARALKFLHEKKPKPFKHRDIKPANILIDSSNSIYLTDFGISKEYSNEAATVTAGDNRFTVKYASPQTVNQVDQGVESDIFSLGCVFLEMANAILGKDLDDMYDYLGSSTGKVCYHLIGKEVEGWIKSLKQFVLDPSEIMDHERHLADYGLDMIRVMMVESPKGNAPKLDDVCKTFDPLGLVKCKSCTIEASHQNIYDGPAGFDELISELPMNSSNLAGSDISSSMSTHLNRITNLAQSEQSQTNVEATPPILVTRPTFVNPDNQKRPRSSGSDKEEPVRPSRAVTFKSTQAQPETSHNPGQHSAISNLPKNEFTPNIPSPKIGSLATQQNVDPKLLATAEVSSSFGITVGEPAIKPIGRKQTEASFNSVTRIVDIRHKSDPVRQLMDLKDIPGKEVLWHDKNGERWRCSPKAVIQQEISLKSGVLWVLPRGLGSKYRIPEGDFLPWHELSLTKNMKRIFGFSMRTMFVNGRYTQEQLEDIVRR